MNGLVGFAFVDGGIVDQSGAPQNFSSSNWLIGGAAVVGVTYFLTPSWFVDLNYSYALTEGHTASAYFAHDVFGQCVAGYEREELGLAERPR